MINLEYLEKTAKENKKFINSLYFPTLNIQVNQDKDGIHAIDKTRNCVYIDGLWLEPENIKKNSFNQNANTLATIALLERAYEKKDGGAYSDNILEKTYNNYSKAKDKLSLWEKLKYTTNLGTIDNPVLPKVKLYDQEADIANTANNFYYGL